MKFSDSLKKDHVDTLHSFKYILLTTHENTNLPASIIPILLALLAGLIALYQVKSNTISSSRITWIENLRTTLSEYCVETSGVVIHQKNIIDKMDKNGINYQGLNDDYEKYFDCHSKSEKFAYKVKLYLNPDEPKHNQIINLIDKISNILEKTSAKDIDKKEINSDLNSIITLSKSVFKEEWIKSKKLFKI